MSTAERVKALGFPLDAVVVIGSGLLDQLGLRQSDDLDLIISPDLFERISNDSAYQTGEKDGDHYCVKADLDIWDGWQELSFDDLKRSAQQLDGVLFIATDVLIRKKQQRGLPKDLRDIALLEGYGAHRGA